jgi:hypothetical protein
MTIPVSRWSRNIEANGFPRQLRIAIALPFEIHVRIHDDLGRTGRRHVQHQHAGPARMRQRLLPRPEQLLSRRLAPCVPHRAGRCVAIASSAGCAGLRRGQVPRPERDEVRDQRLRREPVDHIGEHNGQRDCGFSKAQARWSLDPTVATDPFE